MALWVCTVVRLHYYCRVCMLVSLVYIDTLVNLDLLLLQIHRSSRGEEQTKVDITGTVEAQLSAKLLIEGATLQQVRPSHKGTCTLV